MAGRRAAHEIHRPPAGLEPLQDGPLLRKFYTGIPLGQAENLLANGFIRVEASPLLQLLLNQSCASSVSDANVNDDSCLPQAQDRAESEWVGEDSFYWPLKEAHGPYPGCQIHQHSFDFTSIAQTRAPPSPLHPQTHEEAVDRTLLWDKRASGLAPQTGPVPGPL